MCSAHALFARGVRWEHSSTQLSSSHHASAHLMTAWLGTKLQKPPEQPVGLEGFREVSGLTKSEAAPDCVVWLTPLNPSKSWQVGPEVMKVLRVSRCARPGELSAPQRSSAILALQTHNRDTATHQPAQLVSAVHLAMQAAAVAAAGVEYGEPPVRAVPGARVERDGATLLTTSAPAGREVEGVAPLT